MFILRVFFLILLASMVTRGSKVRSFRISVGLVYCNESDLIQANEIVADLNQKQSLDLKTQIIIDIVGMNTRDRDTPLSSSLNVCENLIAKNNIYAVIIADANCSQHSREFNPKEYLSIMSAISFTCAYYNIPVIDLNSRTAEFSDKTIHRSFIRMSPPYFHQADVWIKLLKSFEFGTANLIRSHNIEGNMLSSRLQDLADLNDIKIASEVTYSPYTKDYSQIFSKLLSSHSKVFLLQGMIEDMEEILNVADKFNLTKTDNVWIVSEDMLNSRELASKRSGFLTGEYVEDLELLKYAFLIVKNTFESYDSKMLRYKPAKDCNENGLNWIGGQAFLQNVALNSFEFEGQKIELNEESDRISTKYNIINIQSNEYKRIGEFQSDSKSSVLNLTDSDNIIWPGNSTVKPVGTKWSSNLKVVVIEEMPFVFKIHKPSDKTCQQAYNNSVLCPWSFNGTSKDYCCYGYCIDLIKMIAKKLKFEYQVYIVPDGQYGDMDKKNNWNGLMGEVLNDKADMILAPITITPDRMNFVDFTKPFKYQGITILVKRNKRESNLTSFLQPFKEALWIMVFISVHVVGLVLYLLDRFSPFAKFKMSSKETTEEDALNLSRAIWFTWGVLLNSGIGEGTPRSFSARVLGMVWAGFAMIMVASYTANLAAFLVLDRPEAGISGINDARLRNPQDNHKYATVKNSAVERYFKRQVELSTMYRTMQGNNYETAEGAIAALKRGEIMAFIWDSVRLEYEAFRSCDLIITGELFGRSSYGLALKKGNPWLNKISQEILELHETGLMQTLDKRWILFNDTNCKSKDSPSTLGLTNMAGVFMLVAGGIVGGIFLVFIEIKYKNSKDKKRRELNLARNAVATWRKNIEKKKMRNFRDTIPDLIAQSTENEPMLLNSIMKVKELDSDGGTIEKRKSSKKSAKFNLDSIREDNSCSNDSVAEANEKVVIQDTKSTKSLKKRGHTS